MQRCVFLLVCLIACVVVRIESSRTSCKKISRDCYTPCLCGNQKCLTVLSCCTMVKKTMGWLQYNERECKNETHEQNRCCRFRCKNGKMSVVQKVGFGPISSGVFGRYPACKDPRFECQCNPGFSGDCCEIKGSVADDPANATTPTYSPSANATSITNNNTSTYNPPNNVTNSTYDRSSTPTTFLPTKLPPSAPATASKEGRRQSRVDTNR